MFENDVFISYSHADDEPLLDEKEGWVSDLHQALEVRVKQLLGKKPKIWRDPRQSGNEYFSDVFLDQLRKTAALVPVFSPSYFSSTWCPRELTAFFDACESSGGLRVGDHARIFKVLKAQIAEQQRFPPEMDGLLGYEFYAVEDMTERVRPYWRVFGEEARQKFVQKVDDLAQDISRLLRQLAGLEPQPNPEVRTQRGFIYLATTTSDLREERESLRRDLDRSGYTVLPDGPLPAAAPEIEAAVRKEVARCQLAVHLIGRNYGTVPEGTTLSVPELQNELAAERSRTVYLPRLVWLAPVAPEQPVEERQKAFIDRLQKKPELQGRMDLLEGSLQDLKDEVHLALVEPPPKPEPEPAQPGSRQEEAAAPQIYLICDQRDPEQEAFQSLRELLFHAGCEPILPLFEGDETEIRQDHEESLRACAAVLLYWGAGNEAWRRRKQSEVQKSAGLGRTGGAPLTALYIAPPPSGDKRNLLTHTVTVLRPPSEGPPPAALLAPFLEQVLGAARKGSDEPS